MSIKQCTSNDIILTDDCNEVLKRLQLLQAEVPKLDIETRFALQRFAQQLSSKHANGVTYESLAEALGQGGISVGPGALEAFMREHQLLHALPPTSDFPAIQSHAIQAGLRAALETGKGLFLQYQPQIDMESGDVIGAEALVRWRNGSVLVSPADFIPVAEQCGLIGEVGAWVMREACAEAARWRDEGLGHGQGINISVNLSVKQFSEQLITDINQVLEDADLSTDLFSVEITESFLAGDKAQGILQAIHNMGVKIAIDDFGTGYSCLSRVSSLPLNTIKIDRAFVTPLGSSGAADAVAETIITLARKLGMKTIAEGVETPGQVQVLQALGCKYAQGFLYARPLSSSDFVDFVRNKEEKKALQLA